MLALAALVPCLFALGAWANVEKTIFLGPPPVNIPSTHPTLEDLRLDRLDGGGDKAGRGWSSLRTYVAAAFPTDADPKGKATWLLLDNLDEGRRYEARVCWVATQPTSFNLQTYELETVFDTPELISSLADYAYSRQSGEAGPEADIDLSSLSSGSSPPSDPNPNPNPHPKDHAHAHTHHGRSTPKPQDVDGAQRAERSASVLLLRVLAAADYVSADPSLMPPNAPPPVRVELVLDPYVPRALFGGALPRSLVPTAAYVVAVAAASWFVAGALLRWLRGVADARVGGIDGGGGAGSKGSGSGENSTPVAAAGDAKKDQ